MRKRPAVRPEGGCPSPHPHPPSPFKWTGNANVATVGEWERSAVQAVGPAGGRLSRGVLEREREGGGGSGSSWEHRTVQTSCLITVRPSSH